MFWRTDPVLCGIDAYGVVVLNGVQGLGLHCCPPSAPLSLQYKGPSEVFTTRTPCLQVQGPAPTPVTAGAVKAAVHTYTYCARTTGQYVISATIDGVHMRGSPASVTASTAEAHAPLCEVRGAPLTLSTVAGAAAWIAALTAPKPTGTGVRRV